MPIRLSRDMVQQAVEVSKDITIAFIQNGQLSLADPQMVGGFFRDMLKEVVAATRTCLDRTESVQDGET